MARADLLKKLFSSYSSGDKELFMNTADEIINDERKINHSILADDLERVLHGQDKLLRNNAKSMNTLISEQRNKEVQLVEVIYPDKNIDDIILSQDQSLQIQEVIREFQNWDILLCNGVPPISKLLFYGPPGCGKTLCAYVLAAEIGIPLMYVRFDALVSSFLGETAGNIRRVFDLAKDNSYVIFFDEFDAIGRSRNDATEHGEIKRVVNTFLQQIDRFSGHSLIVAATNFEQSLDYAIWRRFDDTMYFALPTNEEKERLFSLRLQQFNGPVQAIKEYLNLTQTFSHADIENVCRMIMRKCILDGKRSYTKKEIELAVKKQKQLVQLRKSQYSD